jgi:hypothetical protein
LSQEWAPYLDLVTGILLFVFSFGSTSYFSRILVTCFYGFSFIINVFLMPLPPYLILAANYIIVFNTFKKRDMNILHLVIAIINFLLIFGLLDSIYWPVIIMLNIIVILVLANTVNIAPLLIYNVLALLVPFIRWEYNFLIFGALIAVVYILYAKKSFEPYKYRIALFAVSFPLIFLKFNIYLSLSLCLVLLAGIILLRANIQDVYGFFSDQVFSRLYSVSKKITEVVLNVFYRVVKTVQVRPRYDTMADKLISVTDRINIDAVVIVIVFIMFLFFIYRAGDLARGKY